MTAGLYKQENQKKDTARQMHASYDVTSCKLFHKVGFPQYLCAWNEAILETEQLQIHPENT